MNNLSICIPTFNRYPFLKWTLKKTITDFPGTQIIISDNASTDDTRTIKLEPFKKLFITQESNIGPFENMRAALLAATTKYCMYLGDDDYLLPDQVANGINFLERHPESVCYIAPCQFWDEVEQRSVVDTFYTVKPMGQTFVYHKPELLWNFIIGNHVWPEIIIWRRQELEKILLPRIRAYWAFVDLAQAINYGSIHFARMPFYRHITNHPVGEREKLGNKQCLTNFDEYRSGLEIMAYELFKGKLTPELKINIQNMITKFIVMRLEIAVGMLRGMGMIEEAESYEKRMMMGMLGRQD